MSSLIYHQPYILIINDEKNDEKNKKELLHLKSQPFTHAYVHE